MKVSLSTGALRGMGDTPKELLEAYRGCGYRYFDFNFDVFFPVKAPALPQEEFCRQMREGIEAARRLGYSFPMAHAPYRHNIFRGKEEAEIQLRDVKMAISMCPEMNIDRMTVHCGHAAASQEQLIAENCRYFEKLLPDAEKAGVTLLIENIAGEICRCEHIVENADQMLRLRKELGNPENIGFCWDTGHANLKKFSQYEAIRKLGGAVKAVHLQDNNGYNDDHMPPLLGTVNYDEVLTALLENGYSGPFNMETHIFNGGNAWPNFRKHTEGVQTRQALFDPDPELRRMGVRFMHDIAIYILKKYDLEAET